MPVPIGFAAYCSIAWRSLQGGGCEIEYKFRRGYPQDNFIFEDSTEAVLIQNRQEVLRCGVDAVAALEKLLGLFFACERVEIAVYSCIK